MSNFGRSILEKYGWTDGKGLGREEDGITSAVKIKGKASVYGLGHDVGEEFKCQWWDHVYNKSAHNISVSKSQDGSVKVEREHDFSHTQNAVPFVKQNYYSTFVKAGEVKDAPVEKEVSTNLSYDELFKLCGGKTVHKGARHGIKMTAKLARVSQQEQELMDKWQKDNEKKCYGSETSKEKIEKPKKKKKKSSDKDHLEIYSETDQCGGKAVQPSENIENPKKKIKLTEKKDSCDASLISSGVEEIQIERVPRKHKKDKKKREHLEIDGQNYISNGTSSVGSIADVDIGFDDISPKLSKKEKKILKLKSFTESQEHTDSLQVTTEGDMEEKPKKKKKKSRDTEKENEYSDSLQATTEVDIEEKPKKKKKKKKSKDAERVNEVEVHRVTETSESEEAIATKPKNKKGALLIKDDPLKADTYYVNDNTHEHSKKKKKRKREKLDIPVQ